MAAAQPHERPSAAEEWRATGDLAAIGLHAIVEIAADTHAAVSRRVADHLPGAAVPVMAAERAISSAVYGIVGAAHRVAPRAAARVAAAVTPPTAPPSTTRVGAAAQAASNALWGDRVEVGHPPIAIPMAVRVAGTDLPLHASAVAAAFPQATPHVVVMVHGLVGDERWWHLRTRSGTGSYGDRLLRDHELTPVVVRYNSGRHISDNGRDLSALLESLVAAWPVPVASLSLVGHSMGGLVARSACHLGAESGAEWTARMRALVSLGTPHLGAPLERAAHVTDRALRLFPETEPFSRPLATRSAGIKDLRYGALVEEDWAGYDPDEFLRNRCTQVPLLPHITYYWVSSTLTHDPEHPVGRLLGDGLVRRASANGSHLGFDESSGLHVAAASHLHLMNHPEVYEQLAVWLEPPSSP